MAGSFTQEEWEIAWDHFKFEARNSPAEEERAYVRFAVDNMRRTTEKGRKLDKPRHEFEGLKSLKLAYYTKAIKELFALKSKHFHDHQEIISLIAKVASTLNAGKSLTLAKSEVSRKDIEAGIDFFALEYMERVNSPKTFSPAETLALIEFRLKYAGQFFEGFTHKTDRRIAEALGAFYLIRCGLALPDFGNIRQFKIAGRKLPKVETQQQALDYLKLPAHELKHQDYFMEWEFAYLHQFRRPIARPDPSSATMPDDPWQVEDSYAKDYKSTTYDPDHVTRRPHEIDRLREATERQPEFLVVFKPERSALHATIATAVTRIKMENPTKFIQQEILGDKQIFRARILPRLADERIIERFEEDKTTLSNYIDYIIDDHFYMLNPDVEIRNILEDVVDDLKQRIVSRKYTARMSDSRDTIHMLVSDELMRKIYLTTIQKIVKEEFDEYLNCNPERRLPMKPPGERLAWVTVGGPASGKSSLHKMIMCEYRQYVKSADSHICQVDSDHYKPLLLEKVEGSEHSSRTWWESNYVRQMIIDRLESMIEEGEAPDFWVNTTTPNANRMKIVTKDGAKAIIYVVSCAVEGPTGAIWRAFNRALDDKSDDYLRFLSPKDILERHQQVSQLLPQLLQSARRDLRLFDTDTRPSVLIASMDSYNREMRVFDPTRFVKFVRKQFINPQAKSDPGIYPRPILPSELANAICQYLDNGVSFNFRYSDSLKSNFAGPMSDLEGSVGGDIAGMLVGSQPETYFWAGHGRAEIRDFSTFVNAFGGEMATALLVELGRRYPLSVRGYSSNNILFVNFIEHKIVNFSPSLHQPEEEAIINRVESKLSRLMEEVKDGDPHRQ